MSEDDDKRPQHYRIPYPLAERPAFRIGRSEFRVVDLSEKGIRFAFTGVDRLVIAEAVPAGVGLGEGQLFFTGTLALRPNRRVQFAPRGPGSHRIFLKPLLAIRFWDTEYPVLSGNAEWIEFVGPDRALLAYLPELTGQVEFSDEEVTPIRGRLVRVETGSCALHLSDGIPYPRIIAEQLRLYWRYRHLF